MPNVGFMVLVGVVVLVTLTSGIASIALAANSRLASSRHTGKLILMFSETWKSGVMTLIGLLAGHGTR
jgi:hypothetical protein